MKDKKKKNNMIISAAMGKTFGKIQHPFLIKIQANKRNFHKVDRIQNFLHLIKSF